MKKFATLAILIGLAAIFLASCRKESLSPSDIQSGPEVPSRNNGLINGAKIYTLIKHGTTELSYYGDGRLWQVKTPTDVSVYNYGGFGEIYVTRKAGAQVTGRDTFLINPDGKCFHSKSSRYIYLQNGMLTTTKELKYSYNANGQLKKSFNPYNPVASTVYEYDANSNLISVKTFDGNGVQKSIAQFWTSTPANPTQIVDRFPLNPANAQLEDGYLKVFGKFNKHLFKKCVTQKLNSGFTLPMDYLYSQVLNGDNVVTEWKTLNGYNNQLLSTTSYSWSVSY